MILFSIVLLVLGFIYEKLCFVFRFLYLYKSDDLIIILCLLKIQQLCHNIFQNQQTSKSQMIQIQKKHINQKNKKMATQLSDKLPNKQQQEINWNEFNYPPLLKLMHFRPSEIPQGKKTLVMMAFGIHIAILVNTLLSVIDNIAIGGLNILYSILFFFIFNPIVLFLFYRCIFLSLSLIGHIGLCKQKSMLSLYTYIQPLVIIIEIVIAIIDFIGFNGFVKVGKLYKQEGKGFQATLALIVSIVYMLVAIMSSYLYFLVWKKRSILAKALI